jgi:hypothetical protein
MFAQIILMLLQCNGLTKRHKSTNIKFMISSFAFLIRKLLIPVVKKTLKYSLYSSFEHFI